MVPRRSTRDRGSQKRAKRKTRGDERRGRETHRHSLFGEIPLIRVRWIDASGRAQELLDYDPDYKPPLPPGAVRGDIRQQEFCRMCHVPRYFYVGQKKACVQCGRPFVLSAAEQKYWYETRKFHFASVAVRCPICRRRRRSESALRQQIAAARAGLEDNPDDPSLLLALSEAIVRNHQRCGQGRLAEAVAAARKGLRASRGTTGAAAEALFWEASGHALAGRSQRARALYREFLRHVAPGGRYRTLAREAEEWLAQGGAA